MSNLYFLPEYNTYINLDNVAYIKFDRRHLRIIFSYDYSIQINSVKDPSGKLKVIPDYTYYTLHTEEQYDNRSKELFMFIKNNLKDYRHYKEYGIDHLANFSKVSFLKFKDHRMIINFNNSSTFRDETGDQQVTGYFIYVDLGDLDPLVVRERIEKNYFSLT